MTEGSIVYNFDGIDTVSLSITTFVKDMNESLHEVEQAFENLLSAGWSGAAADAFQGCKAQWHTNATQMAATLTQLGTAVGNASVNMRAADQQAAARF
jgi:WXG100 family type VII secretion target